MTIVIIIIFFLFWRRNAFYETREVEERGNDYKETEKLLVGDCGSRNLYTENASTRTKKKKNDQETSKNKEKKPSLVKTFWRGLCGKDFAIAAICKLLSVVLVFIQPQLLR